MKDASCWRDVNRLEFRPIKWRNANEIFFFFVNDVKVKCVKGETHVVKDVVDIGLVGEGEDGDVEIVKQQAVARGVPLNLWTLFVLVLVVV